MNTPRVSVKTGSIRQYLPPLALMLLAVWVIYGRILGHGFMTTWDDDAYVIANEAVRGFSAEHLRQAFSRFFVGNYAPVQIISYMVDYTFWGLNPVGYHGTDIMLHAVNGMLLYRIVLAYGGAPRAALTGSLLFLCHPLQVEAVAWISQRKTLLSTLFMLLAWLLFIHWQRREPGTGRMQWYLAAFASFLCALLTKAVTVILPLILLLEMVLHHQGEEKSFRRFVPLLPLFLCAAIMAAVTLFSQLPESGGGRTPFHGGSPLATLFTMLPVYVRYLRLLVLPVGLTAEYEVPLRPLPDLAVTLAALLLALFWFGIYRLLRRDRSLFFWAMVFIIGFIPVSQLVPIVTPMNDRYLYLPLLGGAPLFGITVDMALDRLTGGRRRALLVLVGAALSILALLSWQRAAVWQSGVTLWRDVVAKAPLNYEAWDSLGSSYIDSGDEEQAAMAYRRALALKPDHALSQKNLGVLLLRRGDVAGARLQLQRLIDLQPGNAEAHELLGLALKLLHDLPGAERQLTTALQLEPERSSAMVILAKLQMLQGLPQESRELLLRAAQRAGQVAEIEAGLALTEAVLGNKEGAFSHLEWLLRSGGRDAIAGLIADPAFEPIRSSERFRMLLSRYPDHVP